MKAETEKTTKTAPKKRLICIMLPVSLLTTAKSYRRKAGFNSMSEFLRAAVEHATVATMKRSAPERRTQISFRLSESLYGTIARAASQSGQSIARIVRSLLENAPKIGIRPSAVPATKKRARAAQTGTKEKASAGTRKSATDSPAAAKKAKASTGNSSGKSSPKTKSASAGVPAKKAASGKKNVSATPAGKSSRKR